MRNLRKAEIEAALAPARTALTGKDDRIRDLEKQVAEALEQQTATSEILHVITSSPTDDQLVLDVVAENAARLCHATYLDRT